MRVLVSVDLEGVAGVVDPEDIRPGEHEWERNRALMTDEASAAVRGVLAAEPEASVLVCDAHARFRNLLPERLDRRCRLLRGGPRRNDMITGIDGFAGGPVDALLMIGYHGRAGTAGSVLAHTVSGGTIAAVRCNGDQLGEIGLNAAVAAHFGATPVLVSGDETVAIEAERLVPGIHTVTVKWAHGSRAAENLHPAEACDVIEAAASRSLQHRDRIVAPTFAGPVDLEVDLLRPHLAERALAIPGVERRGPVTLGYRAADIAVAADLVGLFADLAGIA